MNHPAPQFFSAPVYSSSQEALVAAAALPLVIYGYPLIETLRTCRLQTAVSKATGYGRAPVNTLSASERQWTHEDRDVVTPANDLLYFCGWINLADGPVTLRVPPLPQRDRYYVVELLDAWTNNFENLGPRNVPAEGGTVTLVGPGQQAAGAHVVNCPTSLVWLLGRVLVQGPDDLAAAHAFERGFALDAQGKALPQCVRTWSDTGNEALDFFQNLFNALRELPPAERELGVLTLLRKAGLKIEDEVDISGLRAEIRAGLENAYRQAMQLIEAHTRSQGRKSWGYSLKLGLYGDDWLQRACTAMKGLGALRADEAIYAMADFDADASRCMARTRTSCASRPACCRLRRRLVGLAVRRGPILQRERDRPLCRGRPHARPAHGARRRAGHPDFASASRPGRELAAGAGGIVLPDPAPLPSGAGLYRWPVPHPRCTPRFLKSEVP